MLFFLHAHPVFAKGSEDIQTLNKEIDSLKKGEKRIQKELQKLKKRLQASQVPPAPAPFKELEIMWVMLPSEAKRALNYTR